MNKNYIENPEVEKNRLKALKKYKVLDTGAEEGFDRITRIASTLLGMPIALISLVDESRQWFKSKQGLDVDQTPREISFCTHTILNSEPLIVNDTLENPIFAESPLVKGSPNIRFYAGAPLKTADGLNLGTLCVIDTKPRELSKQQIEILIDLSSVVIDQLELRLLHQEATDTVSQLNEQSQKVKAKEAQIQAMLNAAQVSIIAINGDSIIETINPATEKAFGYTKAELIGKPVTILLPPDYIKTYEEKFLFFKNSDLDSIDTGEEIFMRRKDGSLFPAHFAGSRVKLENAELYIGIIRDITQQKATNSALLKAKEVAEEASHAKSEFLSRMSHELRTPLNAIIGFCDILNMSDLKEEETGYVNHILNAGNHLTSLINEVLEISRIEAGREPLSLEPVNLAALLKESWDLMTPLAEERKIQYSLNPLPDDSIYILADLQRIKQVLLNIFANAVKYNRTEGTINVSCTLDSKSRVKIAITDSGHGIAKEFQKNVFEVFTRLREHEGKIEGSGVGLALSKALVTSMNGKMGLTSNPGKGSTFWITLQRTKSILNDVVVTDESKTEKTAPQIIPDKNYTVLYIEDNLPNLDLVKAAFKHRPNIRLVHAIDGNAGLDAVLREKPDLILLDIHLPDIPGDEILATLKKDDTMRAIPVVVLSADATRDTIKKLLKLGAADYLTKPLKIGVFLNTVENLLP